MSYSLPPPCEFLTVKLGSSSTQQVRDFCVEKKIEPTKMVEDAVSFYIEVIQKTEEFHRGGGTPYSSVGYHVEAPTHEDRSV